MCFWVSLMRPRPVKASDPARLERPAIEDVQEIRAYIARDSQRYARVVAERLVAAVERLTDHPLSGRVVPEVGQSTLREVIEPPSESCTGSGLSCWKCWL